MIRNLLALILVALPQRLRNPFARRFLGWDLHPSAQLGRSLIRVGKLTMGEGSWIGHRNSVVGLDELVLGEGASIGGRNNIWAVPTGSPIFSHVKNRRPSLVLGAYAGIGVGHELDCTDLIEFGDYAALTGYGSQILTHRLDLARDRTATDPVSIGARTFVMTGCILLAGTSLPDHCILSAGSVTVTGLSEPYTLYRGNPALAIRALPKSLRLFQRDGVQYDLREDKSLPA